MMDLLPPEVLILVLKAAAFCGPKNDAFRLRLVCREFDVILKPILLNTISLDISKLSRRSCIKPPDLDALQTIGRHCKSIFVDMMVLRDTTEIDYLQSDMDSSPSAGSLPENLRKRYSMGPMTFSEGDFQSRMNDILFNCRGVERARLSLPLPLVDFDELSTTFILANALAALGRRPEEDSATLKVLVLECVTAGALHSLLYNPLDRRNIMTAFGGLDHLVLSSKGYAYYLPGRAVLTTGIWRFIGMAESLKSLCLVGLECGGEPPTTALRHTRSTVAADGMPEPDWQEPILPPPSIGLRHLTSLELRRIDLTSAFFPAAATYFGRTLRELYLNRVCLRIQKAEDDDDYPSKELWVGQPNTKPRVGDRWIAYIIRRDFPEMRVCRATHLTYDFFGSADELETLHGLDIDDPCGLKRDLARRFVEVAMGHEQPDLETGEPCMMLPSAAQKETPLNPVAKDMQLSNWDVATYHNLVGNPTSRWIDSIDGIFPNDKSAGASVLRDIAEAWCRCLNTLPSHSFHPDPPESGFRVVYEDDVPLGLLIGRIGPQRLEQFGVDHGDDLDDNWVPDVEMNEGEPGEVGDGETGDEEWEDEEFDDEEDAYGPVPWDYEWYPMDDLPGNPPAEGWPPEAVDNVDPDDDNAEDSAYDDEANHGGRTVTPSSEGNAGIINDYYSLS